MKHNSENSENLRPNLKVRKVNPLKDLLLDPNNPRYFPKRVMKLMKVNLQTGHSKQSKVENG